MVLFVKVVAAVSTAKPSNPLDNRAAPAYWILSHFQIVNYKANIASESLDCARNTVFTDQSSSKSAQTGDIFRTVTCAYSATILVPISIQNVVMTLGAKDGVTSYNT